MITLLDTWDSVIDAAVLTDQTWMIAMCKLAQDGEVNSAVTLYNMHEQARAILRKAGMLRGTREAIPAR